MKITKYLHSCLLIEEQGTTILIDPGDYSTPVLDLSTIANLDYLLFTHEHADHLSLPFVKEVVQKFPDVKIITNPSIVSILEKESIKATSNGNEFIKLTPVNHERVFDKQPPQNVMIELFDKFADPGDSMSFHTDKEILALPLLGPSWMVTQAVEKAVELKPKVIIPIHDWQWKDEFRIGMYNRLERFFKEKGIDFKPMETGKVVEM